MGIKTAGFWLGEQITILTRHINNNETIRIHLDLKNLEKIEENNNKIPIDYFDSKKFEESNNFQFGTSIEIRNVNQRFTLKKLNKIAKKFASKYREDFWTDKLQMRVVMLDKKGIWYDCFSESQIDYISDAKKLEFKPPILKKDKNNKEIKIDIKRKLSFNGTEYENKGWIGVLEKGTRNQPGLTLFRRGRTIKGDDENNQYKPKEIFGDSGSFEYQRVTGWLHLDKFPVTQQKNDFAWTNGLEDEFIRVIKEEIDNNHEYDIRKIARTTKNKESEIKKTEIINSNVAEDLKASLKEDNYFKSIDIELGHDDYEDLMIFTLVEDDEEEYILNLKIDNSNSQKKWLTIQKDKKKKEYEIILNFSLPWFSPFNNDVENVKDQIIKFAIYFAYAEIRHKEQCPTSFEIRNILNKCFSQKINVVKKEE